MRRFRRHALAVHPHCQWCGAALTVTTATTDHLLPRSRGGGDDWGNLLLACGPCNHRRSNKISNAAPLGPQWGDTLVSPAVVTRWVAWTRYPGGRWRRTLHGGDRHELADKVRRMFGTVVEMVLLADPEEPVMSETS